MSGASEAGLSETGATSLRVCVVSTYFAPETTGNAPYATSLANGLAKRGHRVTVLAGAPHYPGWAIRPRDEWLPVENSASLTVRRFVSYVPSSPGFLQRLRYELGFGAKFARSLPSDSDVVVLLSPSLFGAALVRLRCAVSSSRPRYALWIQDLYSAGMRETPGPTARLFAGLVRLVESAVARSVDDVVVIHERFRSFVTAELGVEEGRVEVIRNWTHVSAPEPIDRAKVRSEFGWSDDEVIALHAGNMGAKQGLENVIDAARWAEERGLPVRFVLLGEGNQRAQLIERGVGCGRLEFLDPLPEERFMTALAAADVLLVNERPSLNEAAVPSKLTSYFVTGNPVVAATDSTSTTSDEMRESGAGAIVPPGDPGALARAVLSIASSWGDADRRRGPRFVDRLLSERAGVDRFEALLLGADASGAREPESEDTREDAA